MSSHDNQTVDHGTDAEGEDLVLANRPGRKSYFQGSREAYLKTYLPKYIALGRGKRVDFWTELYGGWWERYPWKLKDDEEPPTDDKEKMASLAEVGPDEVGLERAVVKTLTTRISASWEPVIQRLHQARNPRPRCRTAIQQYMRENREKVDAAFNALHGHKNLSNVKRMNLRHEVAKAHLESMDASSAAGLEERAKGEKESAQEEWKMVLQTVSASDNMSQTRDTLFDAVHPLLQTIGRYAGCYVSLIAGSPERDGDDGFFTAVHWWPGDRGSSKDWTQWNPEAFNAGVAGPFLEYADATDKLIQSSKDGMPPFAAQPSKPNQPSSSSSFVNSATLTGDRHTDATSRSRPTGKAGPAHTHNTGKRKFTPPHPIYSFDESEEEDSANFSGDGSSSGDSLPDDAPVSRKRLRTSGIATRSSIRDPTPSTIAEEVSRDDVPGPTNESLTDLADRSDPPSDEMEVDEVSPFETESTTSVAGAITSFNSNAEPRTSTVNRAPVIVATNGMDNTTSLAPSMAAPSRSPSLTSSIDINVDTIPTFLRSHGKGKRQVDIFAYLNEVKDPRFRSVLLHYIRIEASYVPGTNRNLPTAGRPTEISQWSSRARPAGLPEFSKGKRTFLDFVDSVIGWWGAIQPSWRSFERGQVSREVGGSWEALHATGINGLLNVVILVYWWARVLEDQSPQDGFRGEYEVFADDVAWVFSNISK